MRTFGEAASRAFEQRLLAHLRAAFPARTQPETDERLLAAIRSGIKRARFHGAIMEMDYQRYVECIVLHGADIETNPEKAWAQEVLEDEALRGSVKMERLAERAREEALDHA